MSIRYQIGDMVVTKMSNRLRATVTVVEAGHTTRLRTRDIAHAERLARRLAWSKLAEEVLLTLLHFTKSPPKDLVEFARHTRELAIDTLFQLDGANDAELSRRAQAFCKRMEAEIDAEDAARKVGDGKVKAVE